MVGDYSLCLKVQGVQHVLRDGVSVLGSAKNERYTTILVDDKSICPKHASIRFDSATTALEVMDLCSLRGVTVDRRPIEALTWHQLQAPCQLLLGTVQVSVARERVAPAEPAGAVVKKEDQSFLLEEDSRDFIDCSLEETQLLPVRKAAKSASSVLGASQSASIAENITKSTSLSKEDAATDRRSSFLVPATQQLEDSCLGTAANESLPSLLKHNDDGASEACRNVAKTVPEKSATTVAADSTKETVAADLSDDDEFFIIPETQQPPDEGENRCPSPTIGPIDPVAYGGTELGGRTQPEEDYFQMTIQDDENSNDGLFNNKYIEASQNLMQNVDESYKGEDVVAARASILPERSVDSISFQENRNNTTNEMSRLEWNETKQEQQQQPPGGKLTKGIGPLVRVGNEKTDPVEDDDRSITPELHFNEPPRGEDEREGSVTPEVDFNKVVVVAGDGAERAEVSPVVCLDPKEDDENDDLEISLNQEGCFKMPHTKESKRGGSEAADDIYDIETQALDFDGDALLGEPEDEKCTKGPSAVGNVLPQKTSEAEEATSVYEMETQVLNFDDEGNLDPYGLLTQPMEAPSRISFAEPPKPSPRFVVPKATVTTVKSKQTSATARDSDEFATQPMEPPDYALGNSFASSFRKQTSATARDSDEFATQPMDPPDYALGRSHVSSFRKEPQPSTSSRTAPDPADVETEPMSPPTYIRRSTAAMGGRCDSSTSPLIDPDDLLTQPMSPPKYLLEESRGWKKPSSTSFASRREFDRKETPLTVLMGQRKPVVQLQDIKCARKSADSVDPYSLQTQAFVQDDEGNVYDLLTQPLSAAKRGSPGLRAATARPGVFEISHFDPPINSTARQSMLLHADGQQLNSATEGKKGLEISPSSNKENNTGERDREETSSEEEDEEEAEELDDEFCLAATMVVGDHVGKSKTSERPVRAGGRGPGRPKTKTTVFKVPSGEPLVTPKQTGKAKGGRRPIELTEFLTPEHPLLSLPKPDSILMASGHMRELAASHSLAAKSHAKYHFNDSNSGSDEDDDGRLAFKKSNVSVALERELAKAKEKGKQQGSSGGRKEKESKEVPAARGRAVKDERESKTKDTKKKATSEKATSSSGQSGKGKDKEGEQKKPDKERAKKDDGKEKDSKGSKGRKRKDIVETASPSAEEETRVSARSHRETRDPKRPIDESVDYQAKKSARGEASTSGRPKRTCKNTEHWTPEPVEERKKAPAEPAVPRRESKRQKTGNNRHSSPTAAEPAKKKRMETERPRRSTTASKKVDGTSNFPSSSTTTTGMLGGDNRRPSASGHTGNGGTMDVSVTSSTGSDGSARLVRSSRQKLIFTRMSPDPYRTCIDRAGSKVVDIPELATVLVTDRIFRTYKFLCAVAKGIPIVGQSYLDALQAAAEHESVDPWEHILADADTEKRYKFRLRDTLQRARHHKLFQDYTVFVTSSTQPPPSELYLILSCAGAKALKHPGQPPKDGSKMFVISDPADAATWPKYRESYPSIEIVTAEGFMLSIMQHSISLKKHLLK